MRIFILPALLAITQLASASGRAAELKPRTIEAFDRYVRLTEARMAEELRPGGSFFWADRIPQAESDALRARLRSGEIIVEQLETHDGAERVKAPNGLIHHWVALAFLPGATLPETLALLQDYDHHAAIYKPDVLRSKVLSSDGNHFKIYLRLYRKTIVTAVFNAEFDVDYARLDSTRATSRSSSTRIAEVEHPGASDEREKPVGNDRGFLWRLNSYWRFEERDGGVYVQLESIALSRSVPAIVAWFVNPLLKSIPRDYLSRLITSTRTALANGRARAGVALPAGIASAPLSSRLFASCERKVRNPRRILCDS